MTPAFLPSNTSKINSKLQFPVAALASGTHVVRLYYSGDGQFKPWVSPMLNQQILCG
jgi:hypothetical protein